ncbi:helix-turn-helix transcriptional regulator [Chromobacterium phragmitis]|uniref:helix-turn-helix transcriptional regulator n=1 Tax=Chromobacterium phragmitis TaxID=2202141 RepID=UPI0018E0AA7D|nr:PAS domain-containing protein [Chromobacterium phragmitis]
MRRIAPSPVKDLLLNRYAHIADAIATLFHPYVEAVIHDLHDQTVLHIANNLSRRSPGDDSALEEIPGAARDRVVGPYEKLNWDGRRMRSVSAVLFDDQARPAGMLCLNFNIAVFDEMRGALDILLKGAGVRPQPAELFRDDWQERVNVFLHGWLRERGLGLNGLGRSHKRELVDALHAEGAFSGKSAVNYVANVLGMGRATVYKRIKELRGGMD